MLGPSAKANVSIGMAPLPPHVAMEECLHNTPQLKMAEPETLQGKTWVFTLNNWTHEELTNILAWDVTRMAVAEEVGAEGTPHLQGFVTFTRTYRLAALKKILTRAHWEKALCADWNYNFKDGTKVHRIDNRKQGKRTDIDTAYEYLEQKKSRRDYCLDQRPGYQSLKLYELAGGILEQSRPVAPIDVRWYFGPTGSGKTSAAYTEFPDLYAVPCYKWWDGYDGQNVVLIDDFRPDWCRYSDLLRLLDIYPIRVEFKGGMRSLRATIIIVTAPEDPRSLFGGEEFDDDIAQLERRITHLEAFPRHVVPVIDLTLDHE